MVIASRDLRAVTVRNAAVESFAWGTEFAKKTAMTTIAAGILLGPSDPLLISANTSEISTISAVTKIASEQSDVGPFLLLSEVRKITEALFSGPITFSEQQDPEIASERYFTFQVVDSGEIDEILTRNDEWHARLSSLPAMMQGMFRLSIDAR